MPFDFKKKLIEETNKHCVPIFSGNFINLLDKSSSEHIKSQGTMTIIKFCNICFGITNCHVVGKNYRGLSEKKVFNIALDKHIPIPGRLLFSSTQSNPDLPLDLAIFSLDESIIVNGGKTPFVIKYNNLNFDINDSALAIGYPGKIRYAKSSNKMAHKSCHVFLKCVHLSDRKIVLSETLKSKRVIDFGGMSGGAIFSFNDKGDFNLVGLIYQGRGPTRKDIKQDIWIWGIPLSKILIEKIRFLSKNLDTE